MSENISMNNDAGASDDSKELSCDVSMEDEEHVFTPSCCTNSAHISSSDLLVQCKQCMQYQHTSCAQIQDKNVIPIDWKCADCSIIDIVHDLCANSNERFPKDASIPQTPIPVCQIASEGETIDSPTKDNLNQVPFIEDTTNIKTVSPISQQFANQNFMLQNIQPSIDSDTHSSENACKNINGFNDSLSNKELKTVVTETSNSIQNDELTEKFMKPNFSTNAELSISNTVVVPEANISDNLNNVPVDKCAEEVSVTDGSKTPVKSEIFDSCNVVTSEDDTPIKLFTEESSVLESTEIGSIDLPISANDHKLQIDLPISANDHKLQMPLRDPSEEPLKESSHFEQTEKLPLRSSEAFTNDCRRSLDEEESFLSADLLKPSVELDAYEMLESENSQKCEYVALLHGTVLGNPKLFDFLGYAYTHRKHSAINEHIITWQCTHCNGRRKCKAVIDQINNKYVRRNSHNHVGHLEHVTFEDAMELKNKENSPKFLQLNHSTPTSKTRKKLTPQEVCLYNKISIEKRKARNVGKVKRNPREKRSSNIGAPSLKSSYIIVDSESNKPKLIDRALGFTYQLFKSAERTTTWLCSKSMDVDNQCKASVKQVGECFVRSREKHSHSADSSELEEFNNRLAGKTISKVNKTESSATSGIRPTPTNRKKIPSKKKSETVSNLCPELTIGGKVGSIPVSNNEKLSISYDRNNIDPQVTEYVTIKHGTKGGNPKLYDSYGFQYDLRSVSGETIYWQCVSRNRKNCCCATVVQIEEEFTRRSIHLEQPNCKGRFDEHKKEYLSKGFSFFLKADYLRELEVNRNKHRYVKHPASMTLNDPQQKKIKIWKMQSKKPYKMSSKKPRKVLPKELKRITLKEFDTITSKKLKKIAQNGPNITKPNEFNKMTAEEPEQATPKLKQIIPKDVNKMVQNIRKVKSIPGRCNYIIYKPGNRYQKLIDQKHLFSYKLLKSTERRKIWICIKVDGQYKCRSIVKQTDDHFTNPKPKHCHPMKGKEKYVARRRSEDSSSIIKINTTLIESEVFQVKKEIIIEDVPSTMRDQKAVSALNGIEIASERSLSTSSPLIQRNKIDNVNSVGNSAKKKNVMNVKAKNSPKFLQKVFMLSSDERQAITKVLLTIQNAGLSVDNSDCCREAIKYYLDKQKMQVFPDNIPPKLWLANFIESNTALKTIRNITSIRDRMQHFFQTLEFSLADNYRLEVAKYLSEKRAERIFACDTIECTINDNKYLNADDTTKIGQRSMMTICCVSLAGHSIKPFLVSKNGNCSKFQYEIDQNIEGKFNYTSSTLGNITSDIFHSWLINFDKELVEMEIPRPVIVFVSALREPIAFDSLEWANNRNIFLFCLPKNTSKFLNPLSNSVFPQLTKNYIKNFNGTLQSCTKVLPRKSFASVFMKAYQETEIISLIKIGFKCCGLSPYNPHSILIEARQKNYGEIRKDKPSNEKRPLPICPSKMILKNLKLENCCKLPLVTAQTQKHNTIESKPKPPRFNTGTPKLTVSNAMASNKKNTPKPNFIISNSLCGVRSSKRYEEQASIKRKLEGKDEIAIDNSRASKRRTLMLTPTSKCVEESSQTPGASIKTEKIGDTPKSIAKLERSVATPISSGKMKRTALTSKYTAKIKKTVATKLSVKIEENTVPTSKMEETVPALEFSTKLEQTIQTPDSAAKMDKTILPFKSSVKTVQTSKSADKMEEIDSTLKPVKVDKTIAISESSVTEKVAITAEASVPVIAGKLSTPTINTFSLRSSRRSDCLRTPRTVANPYVDMKDSEIKLTRPNLPSNNYDLRKVSIETKLPISVSSVSIRGSDKINELKEATSNCSNDDQDAITRTSATQDGYNLALGHFDKIFQTVVDPLFLELYQRKFESNMEYPDTTYLIWKRLQELKQISEGFSSTSN